MRQLKILILERLEPPNTCRSRTITIQEISALAHEVGDLCNISKCEHLRDLA